MPDTQGVSKVQVETSTTYGKEQNKVSCIKKFQNDLVNEILGFKVNNFRL